MLMQLENPKDRALTNDAHRIEKKIVELRELIRCTLDRTALPHIREQLMAEIVKLKELGGTSSGQTR